MGADQVSGRIVRVGRPGSFAEGRGRAGVAAVKIVKAAVAEVGPLGAGAGTGDAGGVGAEEVDVIEGCVVGDASEDDEPEEEE